MSESCVSHPISQHLSACMISLLISCRRVWVQTLCCDFECLVFDRNKYLMMMMMRVRPWRVCPKIGLVYRERHIHSQLWSMVTVTVG